jgi:hypothetical protein
MTHTHLIQASKRELTPTEVVYNQMAEDNGFELYVPREQPGQSTDVDYSLHKKGLPFGIMFECVTLVEDQVSLDLRLDWNASKDKVKTENVNNVFDEEAVPKYLTRITKNVAGFQKLCATLSEEGYENQYNCVHLENGIGLSLDISPNKTEGPTDVKELGDLLAIVNDFLKDGKTKVEDSGIAFVVSKHDSYGINTVAEFRYDPQFECSINMFALTVAEEARPGKEGPRHIDEIIQTLAALKERRNRLVQDSLYAGSERFTGFDDGVEFVYDLELESSADLQKVLNDFELKMEGAKCNQ